VPLGTDSLREANRLKWDVVAQLKGTIDEARAALAGHRLDLRSMRERAIKQAVELNVQRKLARSHEELEAIDYAVGLVAERLAGKPSIDPDGEVSFDPPHMAVAQEFAQTASGNRTPLAYHHEKFLAASGVKPRTLADDKRSMKYLLDWCEKNDVPPFLQSIGKREAVRFCDDLPSLIPGLSPVTLNKTVSRLSAYWTWLEGRHEVENNVWRGRRFKTPHQTTDQKERPFTDDEVKALLNGPASPAMHDLMRIAALSGARLDAIVCLKVKDCQNGVFIFKPQKKEPGPRACPIHSGLKEIIARRTKDKDPTDDIFPEWPGVKKSNSLRERSFKTSYEFTLYRREVGVEDKEEGQRRGRVNFHSWRRYFITKAEQAGQPESVIAVVVGHKRQGMTFGVYSAGPLLEQARQCVEAVQLPNLKEEEK
jgi:integrase